MTELGENRPILDLDRFPLPESFENEEFLSWARSLNRDSQDQLIEEIGNWAVDASKQRRVPWIQTSFEANFLRTDPSLFRAIFGSERYNRDLEVVEKSLGAEGLTVEEFQEKLRESRDS